MISGKAPRGAWPDQAAQIAEAKRRAEFVVRHDRAVAKRHRRASKLGSSAYARANGESALVVPAHAGWSGGAFASEIPARVHLPKNAKPLRAPASAKARDMEKRAGAPATAAPASREATRRKSGAR